MNSNILKRTANGRNPTYEIVVSFSDLNRIKENTSGKKETAYAILFAKKYSLNEDLALLKEIKENDGLVFILTGTGLWEGRNLSRTPRYKVTNTNSIEQKEKIGYILRFKSK